MSNGTKVVAAVGIVTAAIVGGKELIHEAPQIMMHEARDVIERKAPIIVADEAVHEVTHEAVHESANVAVREAKFEKGQVSEPASVPVNIPMSVPLRPRPATQISDANADAIGKISAFFSSAQVDIEMSVARLRQPLKMRDVNNAISSDVTGVILKEAAKPDSHIKFGVMTGKLTIDASKTVWGVNITGGEANIYKISGVIAGGVMVCNGVLTGEFKPCVKTALAEAKSVIAKEMHSDLAEAAEK